MESLLWGVGEWEILESKWTFTPPKVLVEFSMGSWDASLMFYGQKLVWKKMDQMKRSISFIVEMMSEPLTIQRHLLHGHPRVTDVEAEKRWISRHFLQGGKRQYKREIEEMAQWLREVTVILQDSSLVWFSALTSGSPQLPVIKALEDLTSSSGPHKHRHM